MTLWDVIETMRPFEISKAEALELLANDEQIETRFEYRPNNGKTIVGRMHRIAARLSIRACMMVSRSGPEAQKIDFGFHAPAEMPDGVGVLFFKTKPEKRVTDEKLRAEREVAMGAASRRFWEGVSGTIAGDSLNLYTIYDHPIDCPDSFVVRRFEVRAGKSNAREVVGKAETLEAARNLVPPGLACLARAETDDPKIVETWL